MRPGFGTIATKLFYYSNPKAKKKKKNKTLRLESSIGLYYVEA